MAKAIYLALLLAAIVAGAVAAATPQPPVVSGTIQESVTVVAP